MFFHADESVRMQFIDGNKKLTNKTEVIAKDTKRDVKIIFLRDMFEELEKQSEGTYHIISLRVGIYNNSIYLGTTNRLFFKSQTKIFIKVKSK